MRFLELLADDLGADIPDLLVALLGALLLAPAILVVIVGALAAGPR